MVTSFSNQCHPDRRISPKHPQLVTIEVGSFSSFFPHSQKQPHCTPQGYQHRPGRAPFSKSLSPKHMGSSSELLGPNNLTSALCLPALGWRRLRAGTHCLCIPRVTLVLFSPPTSNQVSVSDLPVEITSCRFYLTSQTLSDILWLSLKLNHVQAWSHSPCPRLQPGITEGEELFPTIPSQGRQTLLSR